MWIALCSQGNISKENFDAQAICDLLYFSLIALDNSEMVKKSTYLDIQPVCDFSVHFKGRLDEFSGKILS